LQGRCQEFESPRLHKDSLLERRRELKSVAMQYTCTWLDSHEYRPRFTAVDPAQFTGAINMHMSDMASKGWKLLSTETNDVENRFILFFWVKG
jgi:hypothetical protein